MSHTQGKLSRENDIGQWNVDCDANGTSVQEAFVDERGVIRGFVVDHRADYSTPDTEQFARRLVACWNAADGIPAEELEAAADGRLLNIFEGLIRERDELLSALKEARRWIGDGDMSDGMDRSIWTPKHAAVVDLVDAAIARVKGGEA